MGLIDSHAHLTYPDFEGRIDEVLARCDEAGVERIITIGTSLADGRKAIRESFRVLRDGGTVELSILDAQWLFEAWRDGRGTRWRRGASGNSSSQASRRCGWGVSIDGSGGATRHRRSASAR